MEYQQFRAMNSDIILVAEGAADSRTLGFKLTRDFTAASEARLTRFPDTTELAGLNRSAGAWFLASPELFAVVQQACEFAEETKGLFDPTMLAAWEAAGYDKSMDCIRAQGVSAQPRSDYHTRPAFRAIQLDEANLAIPADDRTHRSRRHRQGLDRRAGRAAIV